MRCWCKTNFRVIWLIFCFSKLVMRKNWTQWAYHNPGIIMGMGSSKKRRSCIATSSLIGCPQTKNDPCDPSKVDLTLYNMLNLHASGGSLRRIACVYVLTPHVFQISMILSLRCDVILCWTKCHKASWWTNWKGMIATNIATAHCLPDKDPSSLCTLSTRH